MGENENASALDSPLRMPAMRCLFLLALVPVATQAFAADPPKEDKNKAQAHVHQSRGNRRGLRESKANTSAAFRGRSSGRMKRGCKSSRSAAASSTRYSIAADCLAKVGFGRNAICSAANAKHSECNSSVGRAA